MPHYSYSARTRTGKPQNGMLEAATVDEAISVLQTRDLLVVNIREKTVAPERLGRVSRLHRGVKSSDLVIFAHSLAAMSEAGLPLLRALETVSGQVRSERLATALSDIIRDIRGGSTLRDAVAKHPTVFSPFWISLIETGEASGQLTKALEQAAAHLEKAGTIQRKIVSAMMYPAILLFVAIVAIFVFTLKIIPTFGSMFASFGAQLPLLTQMVINFSNLLQKWFLLIVAAAGAAVFLISSWIKTRQGRWQFDKILLQLPVLGAVFQGASAQEFASNLGTLLRAGVPILHALEIVITTSSNKVIASVIEHMRTGVREGKPLADPLSQTDIFPPMVGQMLTVGEQTGKLPDMLEEIARYYEEQVNTAIERMTTLLEPLMLVGIGLVIGVLVIAMYLPIFNMTSVIK
ncbi:MAG: type II secretion system F family protein [Candidatus Omnitrophica bacterium]|nr:type II secretion system F family protein [Candidatus Omnitrophota bacterium]